MTIAPTRPRVAIFATCFNDTMFPKAPIATVKLLRRLGVDVEFPTEQTCCGQMFTNTGYANDAKGLVRGFVDTFDAFDYVVAPSGSCAGAVREQHVELAERFGSKALVDGAKTAAKKTAAKAGDDTGADTASDEPDETQLDDADVEVVDLAEEVGVEDLAAFEAALDDPEIASRLARADIGLTVMRAHAQRTLDGDVTSQAGAASVSKLLWANWHCDLGELAMDVVAVTAP